ncbi:endomucin, isoform CRA_d [Rattus norvegicus]|uniref:Endomucin, isoform CRA_d n=1 Tax=Rattus norvegicus TaxID=10116 RepID=A6HW02_RAT|nr:endomucin, isoform CRA_d [Rattus norvegicus]
MRLLQVTALFFLLSNSLCRGENSKDVQNIFIPALTETSTTKASATTPDMVSITNKSTGGTPPKGTTNSATPKTPLMPALDSPTTPKHAENQSSIRTTEISGTNQLPDDQKPKTTETPSASLTTAKTISQIQDTEDGKITATTSTTPSYSSVILPVVIALIVITVLVFTLVGLYRICWKRDPGTPESGNDQPQSDKESVKLLTVKTISHESGEHSAQGKAKN